MASTLLALLSQQAPNLETRRGLLVVGLQNDLLPGGKLPVNVPPDYFDRLRGFITVFREFGDVIWVRSEYESNQEVNLEESGGNIVVLGNTDQVAHAEEVKQDSHNDGYGDGDSPVPLKRPRVSLDEIDHIMPVEPESLAQEMLTTPVDEELFLTKTNNKEACCLPDSYGAQHSSYVLDMIDSSKDLHVRSSCYSAFGSMSLLFTLRSKLITELYICGGSTNLSVFATSLDAARHGLPVTLVEDCLLARHEERHKIAITRLREDIEAEIMTRDQVLAELNNPSFYKERLNHDFSYEDSLIEDVIEGEESDGIPVEVDNNEGDEDSLLDPATSRPASSHIYEHLKDLGAYNSMKSATGMLESGRATESSPLSALPNGTSYFEQADEPVSHIAIDEAEITPRHESGEQLAESELPPAVPTNNDHIGNESTGRVEIEDWLEKTRPPTKTSVSSKHPGLQALSSLAGLDQRTVNSYEQMMSEAKEARKSKAQPLFGPDKSLESARSSILFDLLSVELAETIFNKLQDEISWERMFHQSGEVPRLVCCQGTIGDDGSMPVYRHPSDQTLPTQSWSPTVDLVRKRAEEVVGHPLNHALIQLYRGGTDFISEHSDKTLDIVKGSFIVNVSFGAQRTMRLRTKRAATSAESESSARTTYRVPLPHNSMIKMSLETNAEYLHGINADKRPLVELSEAETAFEGQRISLTFRNIGTFLNHDSSHIWGQGATGEVKSDASAVINADPSESERLIRAFGTENQASTIQWDEIYGQGFDVLHLK